MSYSVASFLLQGQEFTRTKTIGTEGTHDTTSAGDKAQAAGSRKLATVEEVNIATLNRRDRCRGASFRGSNSVQLFYESSLRHWFSGHVDRSACYRY